MTTSTMTLFFALLAVAAETATAVMIVLAVAGRAWPAAARARDAIVAAVGPSALALAFIVALVATLGSLYLSEVAHFVPCRLCWYQRIAMYPLVPILAVAAVRKDYAIRLYVGVLAAIGLCISTYHIILERFPNLESSVCEVNNPCTLIWVQRFGYLTIPTMAGSAFALILTLTFMARPEPIEEDTP